MAAPAIPITRLARLATDLQRQRARRSWAAHVHRDPLALLDTPGGRADPYPIYERIRARGPVVATREGMWMSTDLAVCGSVLRDRRFGVQPAGTPPGSAGGFGLSFLELDPPDHTRLRRTVAPAFTPARIAAFRPQVEAVVDELVDDLAARLAGGAPVDLVAAVANPVPVAVICALLGVPVERSAEVTRHGAVIGTALDGVRSLGHARALLRSHERLETMFADLFAERRAAPREDLISTLAAAPEAVLAGRELVPLCTLLLIAGFETTVNLIANGVRAMLATPGAWHALAADPGLAEAAVEETLRLDPPVQRTGRWAHEDLELAGVEIRRNRFVVTLVGGAGRDPAVHGEPDRFDLHRDHREHLAFSGGAHYCLGAPLARLEAAVTLAALAARLPGLVPAGRTTMRPGATIRGPLRLPVALTG